jgi:hypothetical protein
MDDKKRAPLHISILDVDSIQKYIFATNKLKPMIGASYLIDKINMDETERIVNSRDGIAIVYNGGGSTLLSFSNSDIIDPIMKDIVASYQKHGISVTWIQHQYEGSDSVVAAYDKLAHQKMVKLGFTHITASTYFKICEWCGRDYGTENIHEEEKESLVCSTCHSKYNHSNEKHRKLKDCRFVTDINQMQSTQNMLGMVVMDGNDMGARRNKAIAGAGTDCLKQLGCFSSTLDTIIEDAFVSALELLKDPKNPCHFNSIRPIIMGGDDLCFIIDAGRAFDFVERMTREIEDRSKKHKELFEGGISMSTGILFIKNKHPFNLAHAVAESLLRSAKMGHRKSPGQLNPSVIDFHILLSSSCDPIQITRSREYSYEDQYKTMVLTRKPYQLADLKTLIDCARKMASDFPTNKRHSVRQALRMGHRESELQMRKIGVRLGSKSLDLFKEIKDRYLWRKEEDGTWSTGLLDLIELTALVGG